MKKLFKGLKRTLVDSWMDPLVAKRTGSSTTTTTEWNKNKNHNYNDHTTTNNNHSILANEHTPLQAPHSYGDEEDPLTARQRQQQQEHEEEESAKATHRAKEAWKKARQCLQQGDFLIMKKKATNQSSMSSSASPSSSNGKDMNSDRHTMRDNAVREIQSTMDFTLTQCLWAVLIYLGIAVLVYRFLFHRMTIIDAM